MQLNKSNPLFPLAHHLGAHSSRTPLSSLANNFAPLTHSLGRASRPRCDSKWADLLALWAPVIHETGPYWQRLTQVARMSIQMVASRRAGNLLASSSLPLGQLILAERQTRGWPLSFFLSCSQAQGSRRPRSEWVLLMAAHWLATNNQSGPMFGLQPALDECVGSRALARARIEAKSEG